MFKQLKQEGSSINPTDNSLVIERRRRRKVWKWEDLSVFRFYRFKRSKGGKLLLPFIKTLNREYEKKFKILFSSSIHRSIFLWSKDVFQINNYRDTHKSNYLCLKKKNVQQFRDFHARKLYLVCVVSFVPSLR